MKGTFGLYFNKNDIKNFEAQCNVAVRNLGTGTKKATTAGCKELLEMSLKEVPRNTSALADSAYYEVSRRTDTKINRWAYEGVIGYGGNGDVPNPKTGRRPSEYMMAVHENLDAHHPIGKAKFLEDPAREYARERFPRTVFKYAQESLASLSDRR